MKKWCSMHEKKVYLLQQESLELLAILFVSGSNGMRKRNLRT